MDYEFLVYLLVLLVMATRYLNSGDRVDKK